MDMQAVLKAGGVGAGVLIVLSLLGLIPCLGCLSIPLSVAAYIGIGVLAAYWMVLPRTVSSGATNGAVAAIVAALIDGVVSSLINTAQFAISGADPFTQALEGLPPEQLAAFQDAGIDPATFAGLGIAGVLGIAAVCCVIWLVVAAALGAAGGAFWGNSHPSDQII